MYQYLVNVYLNMTWTLNFLYYFDTYTWYQHLAPSKKKHLKKLLPSIWKMILNWHAVLVTIRQRWGWFFVKIIPEGIQNDHNQIPQNNAQLSIHENKIINTLNIYKYKVKWCSILISIIRIVMYLIYHTFFIPQLYRKLHLLHIMTNQSR